MEKKVGTKIRFRMRGLAISLGIILIMNTASAAMPAYAEETTAKTNTSSAQTQDSQTSSSPKVDESGRIVADLTSQYNESTQRREVRGRIGEAEMEYMISQEEEYNFGGLRWVFWAGNDIGYTEISINKKLLKMAYQKAEVPIEIETALGNVCINNDLMRYLYKKAKGSDVKVVLEKVNLSSKQKKIYGDDSYACKAYFLSAGKKITDLGYNTAEYTFTITEKISGGLQAGRLNSKGKLYSLKSRFGGQIGNFRCKLTTSKLGTFVFASPTRIAYAKRVTAVTSAQVKVTSTVGKNQVKLSWKKPSKVKIKGYQIYSSTKKNGTYKRIRTTSKLSFTDSGLRSGSKKYYKVRAYATINGMKFYSKWSSIKAVTVK